MKETSLPSIFAHLFPLRERWLLAGVCGMAIASAFFETLGVASILPFMNLALNPSAMNRYPELLAVAGSIGITSRQGVLLCLGVITVALVALGNAVSALNLLVHERFGARTGVRLSTTLFAGYLAQPYRFHVQRDAPSLLKVVLTDVQVVTSGILNPLLAAVSRAFVVTGMLTLLFLHDPLVSLTVTMILATAYFLVFNIFRVRQQRHGSEFNKHNLNRQRIPQEGLGGVKELQVLGRERYTIERFEAAARGAAMAAVSNRMTAHLPRYVLETIAFGGILLVTLLLLSDGDKAAGNVIPVLALYAFAGYRLLPALQQIFASAVTVRFHIPVLQGLHEDFMRVNAARRTSLGKSSTEVREVHFSDAIRLDDVSFTYPGSAAPVLRDVNLVIRPKESVGLVGHTAAGKTTLADLILGVYEPSAGTVSVDGVLLSGSAIQAWRKRIGYVPQHVFLANASVAENIAFGLPPGEMDGEAVRRAAHLAQADEFIGTLPLEFDTLVGERGVKLSGGERQRIGIARALYHEPEVLVFDEATSALDGLTEDAVMEAIRSLRGDRTVILIAHRIRTIEACDRIIMLKEGRIVADGRSETLLETSPDFRRLVGHAPADGDGPAE